MNLEKVSQLLYQLKIVNQEMTAKFKKSTGFSITRYQLMMILKCKGRCSQTQLQNELKIDSAAVTRHLKLLEEKNLVKRQRNKDNNREVFVEITDEAKADLERCAREHDNSVHESEQTLNIGLSDSEEEELLELLTKLVK
ncbi:MarR family transcriptional regulator [Lactococcus cremoris]|uniref:MarR family transcriptional regulator n=1 Tax=Lactococcus lactis subsp. cremoris TaxID=1359 RepID=UPI00038AE2F8|nr:MarR family transcriptional regulator [Lactococcus cremoris]EQC86070.1 MarR family transcriptional regulator [Lactococcus cremoris subsp. cremoris TIFN7]MCT0498012.1 MarR family transcriptional regulator [Lactococcus cremoris]